MKKILFVVLAGIVLAGIVLAGIVLAGCTGKGNGNGKDGYALSDLFRTGNPNILNGTHRENMMLFCYDFEYKGKDVVGIRGIRYHKAVSVTKNYLRATSTEELYGRQIVSGPLKALNGLYYANVSKPIEEDDWFYVNWNKEKDRFLFYYIDLNKIKEDE